MKRSILLALGVAAIGVSLLGLAKAAAPTPGAFPLAGYDLITHQLRIGIHEIKADGSTGKQLEILEFKGRMMIERGDPFTNADGFREVNFLVKNWEAFAWSDTLDTMITYRLTEGAQQNLSKIVAQQRDRDFPATFSFRVKFDGISYGETFVQEYEGYPTGDEFYEVPPSGNRRTSPTIRGFEDRKIEMDHPSHGRLRFVPIECNDNSGETIATFGTPHKVG